MRFLHTMLRVKDLEQSKRFYCEILGMRVLREREVPAGKYTLCFVGYGDEQVSCVIELTYNWGKTDYVLGDQFGHLAIGAPSLQAVCDKVRAAGGKVTREPGPVMFGTTVIAFIEDPNGYKIELIEERS